MSTGNISEHDKSLTQSPCTYTVLEYSLVDSAFSIKWKKTTY